MQRLCWEICWEKATQDFGVILRSVPPGSMQFGWKMWFSQAPWWTVGGQRQRMSVISPATGPVWAVPLMGPYLPIAALPRPWWQLQIRRATSWRAPASVREVGLGQVYPLWGPLCCFCPALARVFVKDDCWECIFCCLCLYSGHLFSLLCHLTLLWPPVKCCKRYEMVTYWIYAT